MKGLNARIKGVHKSNEGMWEEVGIQIFFLKVDWLIGCGVLMGNRKMGIHGNRCITFVTSNYYWQGTCWNIWEPTGWFWELELW